MKGKQNFMSSTVCFGFFFVEVLLTNVGFFGINKSFDPPGFGFPLESRSPYKNSLARLSIELANFPKPARHEGISLQLLPEK